MGLRKQTKQKNQRNILKIAAQKFKQQGYQQTSMSEIARDAEVGTGTIYNYFPSKGALLITLFSQEMSTLRRKTHANLNDDSNHFIEQLMQFLGQTLTSIEHYPKSFWRELIPVLTEQSTEHTKLLHEMFELELEAIEWFKAFLDQHSDDFKISIDRQQASYTIYSVLGAQTIAYMFDESMTYDQLLANIRKQMYFIFDGKIQKGGLIWLS